MDIKVNKNSNYAFYGTLRSGMENNTYYGAHALESYGTVMLEGYLLYSLGEYPYAVKTSDLSKTITAELFHIKDSSIEATIHEMELSVDYHYDEVLCGDSLFGIYLLNQPRDSDVLLQHGDWVRFKRTGATF